MYSFNPVANGNVEIYADGKRISTGTADYAKTNFGYGSTPPANPTAIAAQTTQAAASNPIQPQIQALQTQQSPAQSPQQTPLANPNANYFNPGQGGNPTPQTPPQPQQQADNTSGQMSALNNAAPQGSPTLPQPPVNSTAASPADNYLQQYLDSIKGQTNDPNMLATQQQLKAIEGQQANVNASRDLGIANVNEQPIAQSFLSGQSVALQNQAAAKMGALSAQAVPLQSQLASQQARLQSAVDVSKAALDYQQNQQQLNKPITVSYGGSVYDPKTGQMAATNNPSSDPLISQAIQNGQLTPDMLTRYGASSVLSTLQSNPNFNFITGQASKAGTVAAATSGSTYKAGAIPGTYTQPNPVSTQSSSAGGGYQAGQLTKLLQGQGKPTDDASLAALYKQTGGQGTYTNDTAHNSQIYSALGGGPSSGGSSSGGGSSVANAATTRANAAALTDQTKYLNNTQRAFTTAQQNLNSLIPFMQKAGVNSASTVPLINSIQKAVNGKLLDAGTIAAFQAGLAGLRAEYAQVLSRGGEVTEGQRAQAASLIPDNLTPAQLQQVADRLNIEGGNAVKEAQNQINSITSSLGGKSTISSSSSAGDYQSYLKAIGQ